MISGTTDVANQGIEQVTDREREREDASKSRDMTYVCDTHDDRGCKPTLHCVCV
jgi:hypothetical protein